MVVGVRQPQRPLRFTVWCFFGAEKVAWADVQEGGQEEEGKRAECGVKGEKLSF